MKKWIMCAFAVMLLSLTLSVTAFAAGGDSGVYGVEAGSGVTLKPVTADNGTIQASSTTKDDGTTISDFYKDAARVQVDLTGAVSGKEYLVIVTEGKIAPANLTADKIVYIDQVTAPASGTVSFNVYPRVLTSGKTYSVCISTNAGDATAGALAEKGSFQYYAAYTLGDVDEDSTVGPLDAYAILLHAAYIERLDGNALSAADVDGDGEAGPLDAYEILRFAAGYPSDFLN